jgi:O-antigen ligase/tetratricopeptide (TPR) repeat protein
MERLCQKVLEGILISIIIFTPFPFGSVQPWAIAVIEVAALVLAFFWFFKFLAQGEIEFVKTPLNLLIIFWLGFILFQLFTTTSYFQATKTEFFKSLSYCMILLVFINNIQRKIQIQKIITTLIVVGSILSLFAIIQDLTWNGKIFWLIPLTHRGRAFGPYVNASAFAGYIGMLIPLSIGYLFSLNRKYGLSFKLLLILAILFMFTAVFLSLSRGGIVSSLSSLVFMGFLLVILRSVKVEKILLFALIVLALTGVAWFGLERVRDRFSLLNEQSWEARLWAWKGTIGIIKDYPILGAGLGTFAHIFPKYKLPQTKRFFNYAHNDYLQLLSEGGVVGFVITFVFLFFFLRKTIRLLFSRRDTWVINLTIGGLSSLFVIFIFSFSDFNLHIPANAVLLCIIIGLITTVVNLRPKLGESVTLFQKKTLSLNPKIRIALYPLGIISFMTLSILVIKPFLAERNFGFSLKAKSSKGKIEYLKRSIELQPSDARYYYSLAQLYGEKEGDWILALNHFRQATSLNPNSAQYYQGLGLAYAHLGREQETIRYLKKATQLEPNNPSPHRAYAICLLNHSSKENIKKAVEEYRRAVELEPKFADEAIAKYSKYQKNYEKLIDILPGTEESDSTFLKFLIKEKGLKFAIDFAEKSLKTYPYNADIHFWIADRSFYDKNFSWEFTEGHYKIAFENAPENAYYRMWHGIHLCHRRQYAMALKDLEMALKMGLGPENEQQAKKYITICKKYITQG